uniref:Uncharacterized protein n=1 Tax=Glycine max TaxID=3847 RepID=K7KZV9_SOYBN
MAYSAVSVPISITSSATMDITKENKFLLHSLSNKGLLCKHSTSVRSYSTSNNCIQATSMQPKHKSRNSIIVFPLQLSVSILPNPLRSFLFDTETRREMNMGQKGINNIKENMVESSEEVMINRARWVQRLTGIKRYWRRKVPKESMETDIICKHNTNSECDCDEDDSVCVAGYEEGDEKEENGQEVACDRDSFSKFLVPVPWPDTKLFSKLAFLCSMAYVIPQIKDSICVPMDASDSAASQDDSEKEKGDDNEQKHQIKLAYDITASAASYVQSRTKDLLSLASKSKKHSGNGDFSGREDSPYEEADETPPVYKSKYGVNAAALTMTVVAAAGTAVDLQSLRSSSCEWFVCDDPDTHTRCFAIQGSYSVASWKANLYFEPTTFEKLLYSPLGKIFILQPDEKTSPPHPLLPLGSGFYAVDSSRCGYSPNVLRAFFNQPHPIETLSNPKAYGSDGTVLRDHDCNNYLKAVNGVFGQHSKIVVRTGRSKQPRKTFKKKMRK